MQRIPSTGADLSEHEIAQLIEQAKIARVRFLFDSHGRGLKAIGLSVTACALAFLFIVGAGSVRNRAFESTALIERLATQLSHVETIPAETAAEISQLLRRPDYDCRQLGCGTSLEKRNLAARTKLQAILTRTTLHADAADR
jgi:hypothetical protein